MLKLLERLFNLLVDEAHPTNVIQEWVYKSLTDEERKTFTTPINKDFVQHILNASWFERDICEAFHKSYCEKGNSFMFLTTIDYVKNGFGFSNYGNVFCHATKYSNPENYEKDCKYRHFVVEATTTPKGTSAKRILLLDDLLDNPVDDELAKMISDASMGAFKENALQKLRITEENKRFYAERAKKIALRDKAISELVGDYEKEVVDEWDHRGGLKKYNFWFEREIDKDTFIKFLDLLELPTKAKPLDAPICPEKVEFEPIRRNYPGWPYRPNLYNLPPQQGWRYFWMGEWDD